MGRPPHRVRRAMTPHRATALGQGVSSATETDPVHLLATLFNGAGLGGPESDHAARDFARPRDGFNGAGLGGPESVHQDALGAAPERLLQWGRARRPGVGSHRVACAWIPSRASMGPGSEARSRAAPIREERRVHGRFNGAGLGGPESGGGENSQGHRDRASMGPGSEARSRPPSGRAPLPLAARFNGAGLGGPESAQQRGRACSRARGFNGAGLGGPESAHGRRRVVARRTAASMGPGSEARSR